MMFFKSLFFLFERPPPLARVLVPASRAPFPSAQLAQRSVSPSMIPTTKTFNGTVCDLKTYFKLSHQEND
eukprot:UN10470